MVINGRYALLERCARGGMAFIFRALDNRTQRIVAVKTLRRKLGGDPLFREMLREEARIGAALRSPHLIRLLDSGETEDGLFYLVLEWVDGITVRDWLWAHTRALRETSWLLATSIVSDALAGLTVAHRHSKDGQPSPVIHRDVSPENILLADCGHVKLGDFGVARARDRPGLSTGPGIVKGKLSYFAPEIMDGHPSSIQSDLFAMGVVLWEALAGRMLHEGTPSDVFRQVARAEVQPLRSVRGDVPEEILQVLDRALEPDPKLRYQSAQDMRLDLITASRVAPFAPCDLSELAASVRDARAGFRATTTR